MTQFIVWCYWIYIFMGKCFYLWNIYGNNIGFIAVVLFISSTIFEKSSSFYDYTSALSTSDLTNL